VVSRLATGRRLRASHWGDGGDHGGAAFGLIWRKPLALAAFWSTNNDDEAPRKQKMPRRGQVILGGGQSEGSGMAWASRVWGCAMAIIAGCAHEGPVILRRFHEAGPPPVGDQSHQAVDIAANVGDHVIAAADGVVSSVRFQPGAGFTVVLFHPHLDRGTLYVPLRSVAVRRGATVRRGQSLGEVGYPPEAGYRVHVHWAMFAGRYRVTGAQTSRAARQLLYPIDPLATGVDCVTKVVRDDRSRLVYPVRC